MSRNGSLWTARIAATLALGLSAFLIWLKATGRISSVVGCGGDDGCAQVLGSRWSMWFGIPVSVASGLAYLTGIVLLSRRIVGNPTVRAVLLTLAFTVILAAAWFVSLLVFVEKAFCPYCIAAHVLGIVFAIAVILHLSGTVPMISGVSFAVLAVFTLIAGQIFGPKPDTHLITGDDKPEIASRRGEFLNGGVAFNTDEHPWIGYPEAPYVIAEYYDYTCKSCRDVFGDLHALMKKHPDKFLVFLSPCPLNSLCNPFFKGDSTRHPYACDLAKLSLAVWRTNREVFPEYHEWLMKEPIPIQPAKARAKAIELCQDAESFATALADPWITRQLENSMQMNGRLQAQNPKMPKLLLGGISVMHGLAKDTATFVAMMEKRFDLAADRSG